MSTSGSASARNGATACSPARRRRGRGGLTKIIDRLVERGWVSRDRPAHNRREVHVLITDDGSRVLRDARAVYIRLLTQTLDAHLDDTALDDLAISMGKLHQALQPTDLKN